MKKGQKYSPRQVMSSNSYEIFHYKDVYLNEISLHHHDFYEVYFFLSGSVRYFIEGKVYNLVPGDVVIISPNELHQPLIEDNSKPYERIVLWLNKELVMRLSTEKTNLAQCFENDKMERENVLRAPLEIQQNLKLVFTKLLEVNRSEGFGSDLKYKIYISEILLTINQLYIDKRVSKSKDSTPLQMSTAVKNNALIQSILAYIEEHIEEDVTLDELSEKFFLSKFYLSRVFKKHTGTTIHKYMVKKKLVHAKELIHSGVAAIDVYKMVGFGDYCNFLKAFKVEYGTTPSHWLNTISNK